MFSIPTCSPHRVDEISFLARRILTDGTSWIEERSLDFFFSCSLSRFSSQQKYDILCPKSPFKHLFVNFKYLAHVVCGPRLIRDYFCPETIYFVQVQVSFILNELYLIYFTLSRFFSKISFLGSTKHPTP